MTKESSATKPAHKLRSGAIEVAIWAKSGEKGAFYSVTMSRSYKQGDEWKQADSFSGDDILVLSSFSTWPRPGCSASPPNNKPA